MGRKGDLSAFDRGLIVGARWVGLSISETSDLLGFSRTTVSRVFTDWCEKQKTSSERQCCGRKRLVDEKGQRRIDRLVQADREATVTQITTLYNHGERKSISEHTIRRTLRRMGYRKSQQKITSSSTPVSKEQQSKATESTDLQKVDE